MKAVNQEAIRVWRVLRNFTCEGCVIETKYLLEFIRG